MPGSLHLTYNMIAKGSPPWKRIRKMNCSKFVLATALVLSFGFKTAAASPVVLGDPSKGKHIPTLQDDDGKGGKVKITTTGIRIDDEEKTEGENQSASAATNEDFNGDIKINHGRINIHNPGKEKLEGIVIPVAFFLFLLAVILGAKGISSHTEQKRLELLKIMVEKGQPVPEAVVNSILTPQASPESGDNRQTYKRYRNAYGFTIAGVALMFYAMLSHSYEGGAMITGLVFLCLGAGGMAGLYLPKQRSNGPEKISG